MKKEWLNTLKGNTKMTLQEYNTWWANYYQEMEEIIDFMSNVGWDEIGYGM
jgi:hypothetical protein